MKHMTKALAVFLLALAMVIGLMPGMSFPASAEGTAESDFETPLTFEAKEDGVTVSLKWNTGSNVQYQKNSDG